MPDLPEHSNGMDLFGKEENQNIICQNRFASSGFCLTFSILFYSLAITIDYLTDEPY